MLSAERSNIEKQVLLNLVELQEKELANGRIAMLGFSGLCTQSALLESHTFPYLS